MTPEVQESVNSAYSNTMLEQQQHIPVSGKKTVSLGGSSETPFDTIDTSFRTIYNDLFKFRKIERDESLGAADKLFYALDQPGHYYFKIFFYFQNPYAELSNPLSSNLLGITFREELEGDGGNANVVASSGSNTALSYLYNNMEYTRFNSLVQFIQLLSDISTKSPWYFQSISGLDQAIERPEIGQDFKIDDERKQITIKCLPDAYDNRIGRLLDLYRSIVYSQNLHKWILPSNLRKFDMGIYIFNSPIKTIAGGRYGLSDKIAERSLSVSFKDYYGDDTEDSGPQVPVTGTYSEEMYKRPVDFTITGSKYIELRGCEIDYNSSKTVYAELDNAEGSQMEYEIIIKFDTAMEDRVDPIFKNYIGDYIVEDLMNGNYSEPKTENPYAGVSLEDGYTGGAIGDPFGASQPNTLLESAMGMGMGYVNTLISKVMMGNIYGFSFGKLDSILSADPMSALMSAGREVNNAKLIAKRISDFTDPDKGTRELAGRRFYDQPYYPGQPLIGHGAPAGPLNGRTLRRPETDHQDEEWDISDKNMYNGWTVTHGDTSLEGKSFSRPDTDHQDINEDISGRSLNSPETDHQDEDWNLSGMNFYQP